MLLTYKRLYSKKKYSFHGNLIFIFIPKSISDNYKFSNATFKIELYKRYLEGWDILMNHDHFYSRFLFEEKFMGSSVGY